MGENDDNKTGPKPGTFEDYLRERARIEKDIRQKFRKKMTVLFSDICGSTAYVDRVGDIAGRAWMQQHHDIALPIIKKHDGKILDIEGDGFLASFSTAISAVKASMAIQEALKEHNKGTDPSDEIHVRIGINTGEILVSEGDVSGITVHVAKRIETEAGRDQILISKTAYEDVCGSEDVICRIDKRNVIVKGVAAPLDLYRAVWQDEDIILSREPMVRAQDLVAEKKARQPLKVLHLEITGEEGRLKISVFEQRTGEESTVRHYEEIPANMEKIGTRCSEIVETLNNANRKGRLTRDILIKLREIGQVFRDELLTIQVKKKMKDSSADHLVLHLDDGLVHIPWELLHDGRQFLCQRFNMGRLVKTRQTVAESKTRLLARPLKMLVIADPKGDLKGAYEEGRHIRDFMDRDRELINISLLSERVTPDFIKEKIRNFDLIHFAGHADYNAESPAEGGWRLSDGIITARDISKMAGTAAMPALIFSNACQSARTEEWGLREDFQDEIFGMANAFILAGVKHFVGTFWEILDEPSRLFALEFYKRLVNGMTMGEAVRMARLELIDKFGEETIIWASYLLYGDPTFNYMDQIKIEEMETESEVPAEEELAPAALAGGITREEEIVFGKEKPEKKSRIWWAAIAGAVVLAFLLWVYPGFLRTDITEYERSAMASYQAGEYSAARDTSRILLEKSPGNGLGYVILANIFFREGDLEKAESLFKNALEAGQATDGQKAEALMGLGRIASIRKDTSGALDYYQQAAELAPGTAQAYTSQAVLLDRQGDYDRALALFKRAEELAPDNEGVRAMANETVQKASILADQERQERIDRLVAELLSGPQRPAPAVQGDGWTSLPLTIWMMDLETKGYSLEEGKEQVIASGIIERIIERSRGQVVERAILDKLLEELKLSNTELVDNSTALSIGRIIAARLILSGRVVHAGPETQVSIRMIETETGEIIGAVNEIFGSAVSSSTIADRLSALILERLDAAYPLRGKVSEVKGDEITLNVGKRQGVNIGQQFRIKDTDLSLEITGVKQDTSIARPGEGAEGLEQGMRVEAM
jgi:class 3 adenylate cyclase/CHAT domain-containing protein/tetratricopeptide (TPR) repeat protein